GHVGTGDHGCIGSGSGHGRNLRRSVWEVAVHEMLPKRRAGTYLTLAGAVIRNEKAQACIQHKVQVAVKIDGVSSVSNDPVPAAALLIKPQRHSVHIGGESSLPAMHGQGSFRAQNLRVLKFSILQVRDHEAGKVCRRSRKTACRSGNYYLKWLGTA